MKTEVAITNWSIHIWDDFIYLSGTADNHPRLGENAQVAHTSGITKIEVISDEEFICETHNTKYKCNWKYINLNCSVSIKLKKVKNMHGCELLSKYHDVITYYNNNKDLRISTDIKELDRILNLSTIGKKELQEKEIEDNKRLVELAEQYENCIYIKLNTISKGSKAAYNIGGETGVIEPVLHIGTFTDTIIYQAKLSTNSEEDLELRYYVGMNSMETYSWSYNIERVIIENMKNYEVMFNNNIINGKETKVFERTW